MPPARDYAPYLLTILSKVQSPNQGPVHAAAVAQNPNHLHGHRPVSSTADGPSGPLGYLA